MPLRPAVSVVQEAIKLLVGLSPFFFLLGGVMLYGFLRSLGLEFLFQTSLGSAGGFAAMAFSGMMLAFCFLAFFALPPAVVVGSIQLSYHINPTPRPRWHAWTWGAMIFLPFAVVFGIGYMGWPAYAMVLILFISSMIFSFVACMPARNFRQISLWLLLVMIFGMALVLFSMPMFVVGKLISDDGGIFGFSLAWFAYVAVCSVYLMEVQRGLSYGDSIKWDVHFRWIIMVGYLLFSVINISSMSFLQGVARGAGIMDQDSQARWYFLSGDVIDKQQPQLSSWLAEDKVGKNYLYGQMAYRFADDRVFCPAGLGKKIELLQHCLILTKDEIRPLINPQGKIFKRKTGHPA